MLSDDVEMIERAIKTLFAVLPSDARQRLIEDLQVSKDEIRQWKRGVDEVLRTLAAAVGPPDLCRCDATPKPHIHARDCACVTGMKCDYHAATNMPNQAESLRGI